MQATNTLDRFTYMTTPQYVESAQFSLRILASEVSHANGIATKVTMTCDLLGLPIELLL
jgi:hypothetical protein